MMAREPSVVARVGAKPSVRPHSALAWWIACRPKTLSAALVPVAVGSAVSDIRAGARVAWCQAPGSYATRVLVPAARAVEVPADVDDRLAAALLLQGMTAHYLCTDTFPLGPGHTALIHAAAGGVGLLLVQLAKRAGARVFGQGAAVVVQVVQAPHRQRPRYEHGQGRTGNLGRKVRDSRQPRFPVRGRRELNRAGRTNDVDRTRFRLVRDGQTVARQRRLRGERQRPPGRKRVRRKRRDFGGATPTLLCLVDRHPGAIARRPRRQLARG